MEINIFQGDVADISAEKEGLLETAEIHSTVLPLNIQLCYLSSENNYLAYSVGVV